MQSRSQNDVSFGLSPLPCGHSPIKIGGPRTFLRNAVAHETANASARKAGATTSPLVQQHVSTPRLCALEQEFHGHVRNPDDFKDYKCSTKHKLQPGDCSFDFHHAQNNIDLGVPTSCAETRRSLGC